MFRTTLAAAALVISAGAALAQGGPPRFEAFDKDANGTLSLTEAEAGAAETFKRLDANADGKIDKADPAPSAPEGAPGGGPPAGREGMLATLDADKNGSVSFAEMKADFTQRFTAADADKSGGLSRAEFEAVNARPPGAPK